MAQETATAPAGKLGSIFSRLPIGRKLIAGFLVVAALAAVVGVVGVSALMSVEFRTARTHDANRVLTLVLDMRDAEARYVEDGGADAQGAVRAALAELREEIAAARAAFDDAQNETMTERLTAAAADYSDAFERFVTINEEVDAAHREMEKTAARVEDALAGFGRRQSAELRSLLDGGAAGGALGALHEAQVASEMVRLMLKVRLDETTFQLDQDRAAIDRVQKDLAELRAHAETLGEDADAASREVAAQVLAAVSDYGAEFARYAEGRLEQKELQPRLAKDARALEEVAHAMQDDQQRELVAESAGARRTMLSIVSANVILALALGWGLARAIARPLSAMTDVMDRLARGDTDVSVPGRGRRDEIGQMAGAVEVFKENAIQNERYAAEQKEAEALAAEEKRRAMQALADRFEDDRSAGSSRR